MRFAVFLPPQPSGATLVYLSGLTCNEQVFPIKAGAQRLAAELGLTLITPDTSPRRTGIEGEDAAWDFGAGAGFYLDATVQPWSRHFRMESYIVAELVPLCIEAFGLHPLRIGISGHSMGGHGALTLALRHRRLFHSVSAFAPVVAPMLCPWGVKAFSGYLGADREDWMDHDASDLMRRSRCPFPANILIDQGLADEFLGEQLMPEHFEAACETAQQPLTLRRHRGYDHGYFFIQTFIEDHLRFHAGLLG